MTPTDTRIIPSSAPPVNPPMPSVGLAIPGSASETALILDRNLPYERWAELGLLFGRIDRAVQWWIGDWMLYGERYGERYAQAVDSTGYTPAGLTAIAWVSSRIEPHRRRAALSWSHHREVAALEPSEQDHWLARAEEGEWTRAALRKAIKGEAEEGEDGSADTGSDAIKRARTAFQALLAFTTGQGAAPLLSKDTIGELLTTTEWGAFRGLLADLARALGVPLEEP